MASNLVNQGMSMSLDVPDRFWLTLDVNSISKRWNRAISETNKKRMPELPYESPFCRPYLFECTQGVPIGVVVLTCAHWARVEKKHSSQEYDNHNNDNDNPQRYLYPGLLRVNKIGDSANLFSTKKQSGFERVRQMPDAFIRCSHTRGLSPMLVGRFTLITSIQYDTIPC